MPTGTAARVLVVEDDTVLESRLVAYLAEQSFDAVGANTLGDARTLLKEHHFDAVILDLRMGHEDGFELLREVVAARVPPVIITSARAEEGDRIAGLEAGAVDYLVKPYSFRELLARLRGVLRRQPASRRPVAAIRHARFGVWTVDLRGHQALATDARRVRLTAAEVALLRVFLDHPQRVMLRHELLSLTRHDDAAVFPRVIDVLVTRLRRKLETDPRHPELITTVRGEGYRLEPEVTWELHEPESP